MQTHPDDQHIFLFEKKSVPGITILPQGKVLPSTSIPELIENLPIIQNRRLNTQHNNYFLLMALHDRPEIVPPRYKVSSQAIISPLFSQ